MSTLRKSNERFIKDQTLQPAMRPMLRQTALYEEIQRLQHMVRAQADVIQELEKNATEDILTGLLNRRGWDAMVQKAYAAYQRYGRDAAVLVIDVNFFKQVNDTYGHTAGDIVLQKVAETLQIYTRTSDQLARPGGDEFSVLLMENMPESAQMKAAHLQDILNALVVTVKGREIPVSVSVGCATFSEAETLAETTDKADSRMYAAKRKAHSHS